MKTADGFDHNTEPRARQFSVFFHYWHLTLFCFILGSDSFISEKILTNNAYYVNIRYTTTLGDSISRPIATISLVAGEDVTTRPCLRCNILYDSFHLQRSVIIGNNSRLASIFNFCTVVPNIDPSFSNTTRLRLPSLARHPLINLLQRHGHRHLNYIGTFSPDFCFLDRF
jgi:hypothetical protein